MSSRDISLGVTEGHISEHVPGGHISGSVHYMCAPTILSYSLTVILLYEYIVV